MTDKRGSDRPQADLTPSLVVRLRDGHAEAGQLLDELYRQRLVRFALGYLRTREEAEDVVQDVFCRVLESAAVPNNFRAWVYEICRNRCIDRLRASRRRLDDQTLPESAHFAADATGNLTRLVRLEQREHLWRRLAALPPDQREVVLLRYTEGLSRAEISDVLGIPENLVKHRIYNALEKLRKHTSLVDDR